MENKPHHEPDDGSRIVYLFGDFSYGKAQGICRQLIKLDREACSSIYLIINSPGGLACETSVMDIMDTLRSEVVTVVTGEASSAAAGIAMAGRRRYITSKSVMLIHETTWGSEEDRATGLREHTKNLEILNDITISYVMKYLKCTKKKAAEVLKGEILLTAKECVKLKVMHKVLTTKRSLYRLLTENDRS